MRVNGGKLTTYREMAEDTVDVVAERLGAHRRARRSGDAATAGCSAPTAGSEPDAERQARSTTTSPTATARWPTRSGH